MNLFATMGRIPDRGERDRWTAREAQMEPVYQTRGFSGHWLYFFGLPALFFLYFPAGTRPTRREED